MELRNRNVKFNDKNRPNLCYPFFVNPLNKDKNGLMEISLEPHEGFLEVWPAKSNGIQTVWRWGKEEKARKNAKKESLKQSKENEKTEKVEEHEDDTDEEVEENEGGDK
jgi:adenine-specific DNA-methyltransferase